MGVITNANKVYIKESAEEGSCSIEHKEGQVLLLDFWATWCPPCQAPMAHNQDMLEKRGADWGDKVRLIGLSIDNDAATVKSHVEAKKWQKIEHYHVRTPGCAADTEYGVQGVPHVLLIDTTGKIVFMGHPASRNIENDIDALLKGETLSGEGTGPKAVAADAKSSASGSDEVDEAIRKFKKESKTFCESIKDKTSNLKRAFLVMVDEASYDFKSECFIHDVKVITQLMGPQEDIDAVKAEAEKVNQGPWENVNQFRVM